MLTSAWKAGRVNTALLITTSPPKFGGTGRLLTVADLNFSLPDEFVEHVAERAAALVAERNATATEDGWLRGAKKIAAYIDCPVSRVYALNSAGRLPVEHDGSALIARCSELDGWVRDGGGKRP